MGSKREVPPLGLWKGRWRNYHPPSRVLLAHLLHHLWKWVSHEAEQAVSILALKEYT